MSNIREVAKLAGVSVATVSRAIRNPEKVSQASIDKVTKAIEEVDYRPNMPMRNYLSNKTQSFIVLVPNISNPFFSILIKSIELRAQERGYSVLLGDTQEQAEREQNYIKIVENNLADGIIQLRPHTGHDPFQESADFPYINVCGCENTAGRSIRIDDVCAMKAVVKYLSSMGHKRIGLIGGDAANPHCIDRSRGYHQALSDANIDVDETIIVSGDYSIWSGVNAADTLFELDELPTAVVCMNDEMAIGAIQSFKSKGLRIPEDISITGFDNIDYAKYCSPPLSTISQPANDMGRIAVDSLIDLIEGKTLETDERILPYEFILRESTAPPSLP
ncbi:MAG: LacI family repressor for deo operon, udp, cdd, tsx, nupC, and nupG [Flavobacteriales bacterium]|jgi:LacI family repressor for deo operon, udp, cdd, tsx, nupC, and nupG